MRHMILAVALVLLGGVLATLFFAKYFAEAAVLFGALILIMLSHVLYQRSERCPKGDQHDDDYETEGFLVLFKKCTKCGRRQPTPLP